jgi:selT/selW/selH-like putative selenoprotein
MEIQQIMEKNFQNVIVKGEEYPLHFIRKILSYLVTITQISVFTTMILGESIKPFLINIVPGYLIDWIIENKLLSLIISFFAGNILQSNISNTGAFEIFYNGNQIWSKLQTGNVPNINQLIMLLNQNGANFLKN